VEQDFERRAASAAMRGTFCIVALFFILPTMHVALSSPGASGELMQERSLDYGLVRIHAILPDFACESVTIINLGKGTVDLDRWTVSDGEGWLTFRAGVVLGPGEKLSLCSNSSMQLRLDPRVRAISFVSTELDRKGRFALADQGDEVQLLGTDGSLQDVIPYGATEHQGPGWVGPPVAKPGPGRWLVRTGGSDTDSSVDWLAGTPGRSDFDEEYREAYVEPFLCPDNARSRLLREIHYAQKNVSIAIYEIGDEAVGRELLRARARGVEVRLLVEGQPVGGIPSTETRLLSALQAHGCDVHLVKAFDGYRRYDFVHCKYAVIDARRLVVTSENWMHDSLNGNRGWGVSVEDESLARYFLRVFEADYSLDRLDVVRPEFSEPFELASGPGWQGDEGNEPSPASWAGVTTVLSPENSLEVLRGMVRSASRRVLVEQFYCEPALLHGDGLVSDLLEVARRGVLVQVLLDGSWYNTEDGGKNSQVVEHLVKLAESYQLPNLQARLSTPYHGFEVIHNKGVIVDDTVLVSSINWGTGPFDRNREVGLMVESRPVADFFSLAFAGDWVLDPSLPAIIDIPDSVDLVAGSRLMLNANNCSDPAGIASYLWDVGADGSYEWNGPRCYLEITGDVLVRLTVIDSYNNTASKDIRVHVVRSEAIVSDGSVYLGLLASIPLVWAARKRIKRNRTDGERRAAPSLRAPGSRAGVQSGLQGAQRDLLHHGLHRSLHLLARRFDRIGGGRGHHRVRLRHHGLSGGGAHPHVGRRTSAPNERAGQPALPVVRAGVREQGHEDRGPGGAGEQPTRHKVLPEAGVPDHGKDRFVLHKR